MTPRLTHEQKSSSVTSPVSPTAGARYRDSEAARHFQRPPARGKPERSPPSRPHDANVDTESAVTLEKKQFDSLELAQDAIGMHLHPEPNLQKGHEEHGEQAQSAPE